MGTYRNNKTGLIYTVESPISRRGRAQAQDAMFSVLENDDGLSLTV